MTRVDNRRCYYVAYYAMLRCLILHVLSESKAHLGGPTTLISRRLDRTRDGSISIRSCFSLRARSNGTRAPVARSRSASARDDQKAKQRCLFLSHYAKLIYVLTLCGVSRVCQNSVPWILRVEEYLWFVEDGGRWRRFGLILCTSSRP
jgi:hypothetical protein